MNIPTKDSQTKCGFVTIIGAPNAGKSTLTNCLVGEKVTIVSAKVQTTRSSVKGIMVEDNAQLIFCDTPGIFEAKKTLEKAIVENALEQISKDMEIVFIFDGKKISSPENKIILEHLKKLTKQKKKIIFVINKVDLLSNEEIDIIKQRYDNSDIVERLFFISAEKNINVNDLKEFLIERAEESPFLYPEDQFTTVTSRFLAQEITREKLYHILDKELPYNLSVDTQSWKENDKGDITIHQEIYVMTENQKKIVIGANGHILKQVGILARTELSKILDTKVNLFLYVKVRPDWLEKPHMYTHMNLKFPR